MEENFSSALNVVEFHFKNEIATAGEVTVRHHIELSVQYPNDGSLTERAIMIHLQGSSEDYKLEINIMARVIFDFGEEAIEMDDETFVAQYGKMACAKFHEEINAALEMMGTKWEVPEIPFRG